MNLDIIHGAVEAAGFTPRGAFHTVADDAVPALSSGAAAATVVMIGNAGPAMWQRFSAERDPTRDLLDDWTHGKLSALAVDLGGQALFPFSKPALPFQRWAARAEDCHPSPLGILIHAEYGLWHAYRGALAFAETFDPPPRTEAPSPCDSCADKPCLKACPVSAFDGRRYDVDSCVAHISTPAGEACMAAGCLARRACPVGGDFTYVPDHQAFHMLAFRRSLTERRDK